MNSISDMRIERFIASRIFSSDKDNISATVIRIALLSVALGIAVMLISIAVLVGFKQQIRDKVIGFAAHIQIEKLTVHQTVENPPFVPDSALWTSLESMTGVVSVQKVANKGGIIRTDEAIQGVVLKGIDTHYDWSYLQDWIIDGRAPQFNDTTSSDEVLISKHIADKLMLQIGDPMRMWFVGSNGHQARGRRFSITGIYQTGLVEFDELYVFGDIKHVQRLNGWQDNEISSIEVKIDDISRTQEIADRIYFSLPVDLAAYSAYESYPQIFDWLNLQDVNVIVILILMVCVSGITMISTLLILIIEKTPLIGLLKAMGARNRTIRSIFFRHSLRLLGKGLITGNIIALLLIWLQHSFGILKLPAESYYLSEVPVAIAWLDFLLVNAGAVLLWMASFTIPVAVVNKISPTRSIKFN
ncbi:MAG: ABC transporter permease [Bacteroidales bacterium]|nr:ABC transporter permease [Bacteroidales bacterium]